MSKKVRLLVKSDDPRLKMSLSILHSDDGKNWILYLDGTGAKRFIKAVTHDRRFKIPVILEMSYS